MGVNLGDIIPKKEIELVELSGKRIAIDAYNQIYQFLSIIRDRFTGEPLKDSKNRITSHLSGLLYRTSNLLEVGIRPVFIFDGEPPEFKQAVIEGRREAREEAKKKWEEAVAKGEPAMRFAQAASKMTDYMVESSQHLLDYMGIPWIQAPSEGEAMCAHLCKRGAVYATGSQDADALLFGSPLLVRNLSITGRRKVPKKETYIEVKPELIDLSRMLKEIGITQEQLIIIGILVGTDYAPGVKGVGTKTALKIVKEQKTLEATIAEVGWDADILPEKIYNFFLKPPITNKYKMEWKPADVDSLREFMIAEHDFSRDRVEKVIERLEKAQTTGTQSSLKGWLRK